MFPREGNPAAGGIFTGGAGIDAVGDSGVDVPDGGVVEDSDPIGA